MRPHRRQPTRLPCPWDSPGKNTGVGCHFLLQCMKVKSESEVAQSCPTLSHPMDCSPPGSSIHGVFQARVLEWGAIAFSASPDWVHSKALPLSHSGGRQMRSWQPRSSWRLHSGLMVCVHIRGDYYALPNKTNVHKAHRNIFSQTLCVNCRYKCIFTTTV